MSVQPHSSSVLSREALSVLRHRVRIPLYQIISYADILAEDVAGGPDESIPAALSKVISVSEAALRVIIDFPPVTEDVEKLVTSLQLRLLDAANEVLALLQEMQKPPVVQSLYASRPDIEKLGVAAQSFRDTAGRLDIRDIHAWTSESDLDSAQPQPLAQKTGAPDRELHKPGLMLVVDDNEANRDILSRRLLRDGYEVMLAENGRQALKMARRYDFDLVLLDIMMPELDGFAVLQELKNDNRLRGIPVVMITAINETESVVRCIELGADDYLPKPFNRTILRARVAALLERKRLQDAELNKTQELVKALAEIKKQRQKAEELLLNILPSSVAQELQTQGSVSPMYFEDVTIVFADFVGFTRSTEDLAADVLVRLLHEYFSAFDEVIRRYSLEKLKTIGDCYMFVGGLPERTRSHPVDAVLAAFEMEDATREISARNRSDWKLRIGIHTGPVIAGVVGLYKFAFDIWGESVNHSSRIESSGAPGRINLSRNTYIRVKDFFSCESRGAIRTKEGREVEMYFANGIASSSSVATSLDESVVFAERYRTYFGKVLPAFPTCLARIET